MRFRRWSGDVPLCGRTLGDRTARCGGGWTPHHTQPPRTITASQAAVKRRRRFGLAQPSSPPSASTCWVGTRCVGTGLGRGRRSERRRGGHGPGDRRADPGTNPGADDGADCDDGGGCGDASPVVGGAERSRPAASSISSRIGMVGCQARVASHTAAAMITAAAVTAVAALSARLPGSHDITGWSSACRA